MLGILIIVENLPVPQDRRVWQEATALARAGYTVSVICPKTDRHPVAYERLEDVHIYRHYLPEASNGVISYLREYSTALFHELRLAWKIYRLHRFQVIQACNPPDTIFSIGLIFRIIFKTKFVFDHHDPFAALFELKFPRSGFVSWLPRLAERWSLRSADIVISTSEQLRKLAVGSHGVSADRVRLVRSGLDIRRTKSVPPDPALRQGRRFLCLYVGIMGVQDGVDILLHAVSDIVHVQKRTDIHFALAGSGTEVSTLKQLCKTLGIDDFVEFTGFLQGDAFYGLLATADIGLCPDPKNKFNDKLSMNKVLEYMAFGIPVVQFDLDEGRHIAQEAAAYALDNSPQSLAEVIVDLIDDPERRSAMGKIGKERISREFNWEKQEMLYLDTYRTLIGAPPNPHPPSPEHRALFPGEVGN